jgi:hypothetical protein
MNSIGIKRLSVQEAISRPPGFSLHFLRTNMAVLGCPGYFDVALPKIANSKVAISTAVISKAAISGRPAGDARMRGQIRNQSRQKKGELRKTR